MKKMLFSLLIFSHVTVASQSEGQSQLQEESIGLSKSDLRIKAQNASKNILAIKKQFKAENERVCIWFEEHAALLTAYLRQAEGLQDALVDIMGSHRWKLNHFLSDINGAVVTKADPKAVLKILALYYKEKYQDVAQLEHNSAMFWPENLRTKEPNKLVMHDFTDEDLGEISLEYEIQSPEKNLAFITSMESRLREKFNYENQFAETFYSLEMMAATYKGLWHEKAELTKWMSKLPN